MSRVYPKHEFGIFGFRKDFLHIPKANDADFIPVSADMLTLSRVSRISE